MQSFTSVPSGVGVAMVTNEVIAVRKHDSFKGGMDMSSVSVHGCTLDPSIGVWGRGLNFVLCGTVVMNFVIYIFVGWL